MKTVCLEAHDTPGGVAHSFARYSSASKTVPFRFDSGPSLISGLSSKSTNPLRQVLDAVGTAEDIIWKQYDGWVIHDYADGKSFKLTTGDGGGFILFYCTTASDKIDGLCVRVFYNYLPTKYPYLIHSQQINCAVLTYFSSGEFEKALEEKAGKESRKAFEEFKEKILAKGGIAEISTYIPPFALRSDLWVGASLADYFFKLLSIGTQGLTLTGPFSKLMDQHNVSRLHLNLCVSFSFIFFVQRC
jgi:hypothetical protein